MQPRFSVRTFLRLLPGVRGRNRPRTLGIAPEFDDHDLIRIAASETVLSLPGWDRPLALRYGGLRRG